jgi:hypothetical protein
MQLLVENIDPAYILQPVMTILFSVALVVYWHYRRTFRRTILTYSLVAYFAALSVKVAVQALTFNAFQTVFSGNLPALGVYFGSQTVLFEVGGAFLVAVWAVSQGKMNVKDAEGYGLGLAFWENAGFVGILGLFTLIATYITLTFGGPTADAFYSSLIRTRPELFYPPSQALPLIGYGLLERVTSLQFHFSWGYLCLLAAHFNKRKYFLLALPLGLIDFFVPFASSLTIPVFELLIFTLGLLTLGLTLFVTRNLRRLPAGQS